MATAIEQIMGGNTCLLIDSAAAVTGKKFRVLQVTSNAVLSVLKTAGNKNLLTEYNLTGKTIPAGTIIPYFNGDPIADVTVTSGQVFGYDNVG